MFWFFTNVSYEGAELMFSKWLPPVLVQICIPARYSFLKAAFIPDIVGRVFFNWQLNEKHVFIWAFSSVNAKLAHFWCTSCTLTVIGWFLVCFHLLSWRFLVFLLTSMHFAVVKRWKKENRWFYIRQRSSVLY